MNDQRTLENYCLLILTYMASADSSFHAAEEDAITENISRMFPGFEQLNQRLAESLSQIHKAGNEQIEKHIQDNSSLLGTLTSEQRKSLYSYLFEVLNADGRVNEEETRFLRTLRTYLTV